MEYVPFSWNVFQIILIAEFEWCILQANPEWYVCSMFGGWTICGIDKMTQIIKLFLISNNWQMICATKCIEFNTIASVHKNYTLF